MVRNIRDNFGPRATYLYIPNDALMKAGGRLKRIRLLSVRVASDDELLRLGFTQCSEVYVFDFAAKGETLNCSTQIDLPPKNFIPPSD